MKYMIACLLSLSLFSSQLMALPEIQRWQSPKGMQVYFIHSPELPMMDIELVFKAAAARDGEHFGLANLTNGLLAEGAGGLSAAQLSEAFDAVGAEFGNGVARDMAWVKLRSLSAPAQLEPALETFANIIAKADFPEKAFLREQQRLLQSLKYDQQSPGSLASNALYAALYPNHPYGHPSAGMIETVEKISREQVMAFYQRYYVAANAVVAVVGNLDRAAVEALVAKLEQHMVLGKPAEPLPPVPEAQGIQRHVEHSGDQVHILLGQALYTRGDPDYFPLYLGNYTLGGGGLVSRLSHQIREERGLSYSVYSHFIPMQRPGPFILSLQTAKKNKAEALQLSREILQDFIKNGVTDEEVLAAKKNMIGSFALNLDSNKKLLQQIAMIAAYDLPLDYLSTWINKIKAVTPEQIRSAFQKRLQLEKMSQITVGP